MFVKKILKEILLSKSGSMLVFVMIFGFMAFTVIILGVSGYAMFENKASNHQKARTASFHIAEAGVNYYRWHLAHNPTDYQDGTGQPGPYLHEHKDKDGNLVGYFSLEIDEPLSGSTIVVVRSTGWLASEPNITRTIQVRVGFPALTDYSFVENSNMNFSPTTQVHGKVHANGGIKFDGTTDAVIQSAKETYQYGYQTKPGIWGDGGPTELWDFPVAPKDFNSISADLAAVRDLADNGGIHLNSSGQEGWHIVFKANGTFDLYRVTQRQCYYGNGYFWWWWWVGDTHCYDIQSETFVQNYQIPENGAVFIEDDVWVDGVVDGRVTIGAGRFPVLESTYQEIYLNGNITYEEQASDDVLGLIAQGDVIAPYDLPDDLVINAAVLSQFKKIIRPYYHSSYNPSIKNSLTFLGSQISYDGGGWKWGNPVVSGFVNTNYIYDGNLRYFPPPGFPVGNTYELISWEEIE